ncbi:DUF2808 domain-containing protein [Scytonema hofmannii FACHB-248]|uniref:DUF2808 domain-containing protein n=1 Tax=Scytonema hofmannii FACHB-248 TaxID=1842502 RepID=A0ABR8GQQ0_9CYAN|nr:MULTISPECIES: DUF2808 domain-containing protein [Nostocales]MBD2605775.1 DUF2808 domain-containing protein [Scytonema hofmannii FACHB-248]
MKKLLYAATLTLAIASSFSAAWAKNPNDAKISHLGNSAAIPNYSNTSDATHKFDVHVQGKALSGLSINLPEGISIDNGIEVKEKSGKKIPATVSINNRKAAIAFSEPVAPGRTISVSMNGINTPFYASGDAPTWLYQVSAQKVDFKEEIPLGLPQVQIYPD